MTFGESTGELRESSIIYCEGIPEPHVWNDEVEYAWIEDSAQEYGYGYKCMAIQNCTNMGCTETRTDTVTATKVVTPATAAVEGKVTYNAVFAYVDGATKEITYLQADANHDGLRDVRDLVAAKRISINARTYSAIEQAGADVDGDDEVDKDDFIALRRILLGRNE